MDGEVVLPALVRGLTIDKSVHAVAVMLLLIFDCFAVIVLCALAAGPALVERARAAIAETGGRKHLLGPDCSINSGTPDALLRAVGHAL